MGATDDAGRSHNEVAHSSIAASHSTCNVTMGYVDSIASPRPVNTPRSCSA